MLIESNQRPAQIVGSWLVALLFAGLIGTALHYTLFKPGGASPFWVLCLLSTFALVAAGLFWSAARATLEYSSQGGARLRLRKPATTGGTLSATFEIDHAQPGHAELQFELVCVRTVLPKGEDNRSSTAPWIGVGNTTLQLLGTRAEARVELAIPAYLPATQSRKLSGERHDLEFNWDLCPSADGPFRPRCPVPVGAASAIPGDVIGPAPCPTMIGVSPQAGC